MSDLENLTAFITTVEEGSFSAAARKLGKAQSAVSTAIANLEIDLATELFSRAAYRPELTRAGRSLLEHAYAVLESHARLKSHAEALEQNIEPALVFAIDDGLLVPRVRDLINSLATQFPTLNITCHGGGETQILHHMANGTADIALVAEQQGAQEGYQRRGIGFLRSVPVCSITHPLAAKDEVSRSDLARYRQIASLSLPTDPQPADHGPLRWQCDSLLQRHALIRVGLGWGELPVEIVTDDVLADRLKVLRYDFAQNAILNGVDLLLSTQRPEGRARAWLISEVFGWDQRAWTGDHRVGAPPVRRPIPPVQAPER